MNDLANQVSFFENLLIFYARRFPIRRGKLRSINSFWRVALNGRGTKRLADLRHGNFKMLCDLSEMLQRQFYFFGTYFLEEDIIRCWENVARNARVIFDVGANAGIYSLAALGARPDATVHAFEPTPEIAARLRETAAINGLVKLHTHEAAVSDKSGRACLRRFRGESGENEGMNFISAEGKDAGAEYVPTVSLDQFCADQVIDRIDLLKIDIQGQEHLALMGAEGLLKDGRIGTIFMELNWAGHPGAVCPASESIRLLEKAGYRFSAPQKRMEWKEAGDWMRSLGDVIAQKCDDHDKEFRTEGEDLK